MDQTFMKEKNILPLVLSMSLPMVISMAVNSLYNIVDSYFVAKLSEEAMTALALVYPIQNLVTSIGVGFGIGINALISFYLGAQEKNNAHKATTIGMGLSVIHGIVLTILCLLGMPGFLRMFSSNEYTISLALQYSDVVFTFAIVSVSGISFEKVFGQFVSLAVYIIIYFVRPMPVKIKMLYMVPDKLMIKRLYSVGIPATLNMALPSLLISALNGILAEFSEKYVLVLGVYYKLQTFIYLSANGIIQGIRPLVGYNYGAGEHKRVDKIFKTAMKLTVSIMILGTILAWVIPYQLIGLFTANSETIKIGVTALRYISCGFAVSAVSVTCSGALEGLGKGMPSLFISLSRYVVIIIPAAYILSRFIDANGVWAAFVVAEFVTAIYAYITYKKNTKIESK